MLAENHTLNIKAVEKIIDRNNVATTVAVINTRRYGNSFHDQLELPSIILRGVYSECPAVFVMSNDFCTHGQTTKAMLYADYVLGTTL